MGNVLSPDSVRNNIQSLARDEVLARKRVDKEISKYTKAKVRASVLKQKLLRGKYISYLYQNANLAEIPENVTESSVGWKLKTRTPIPNTILYDSQREVKDTVENKFILKKMQPGISQMQKFTKEYETKLDKNIYTRTKKKAAFDSRDASIFVRRNWIELYLAQQNALFARGRYLHSRLEVRKNDIRREIVLLRQLQKMAGLDRLNPASVLPFTICVTGVPEGRFFDARRRLELTMALSKNFLYPSIVTIYPGKQICVDMRIDMIEMNAKVLHTAASELTHTIFKTGFDKTINDLKTTYQWPMSTKLKLTKIGPLRDNYFVSDYYNNSNSRLHRVLEDMWNKRDSLDKLTANEDHVHLQQSRSKYLLSRLNILRGKKAVGKSLQSYYKLSKLHEFNNTPIENTWIGIGNTPNYEQILQSETGRLVQLLVNANKEEEQIKIEHTQILKEVERAESKSRMSNVHEHKGYIAEQEKNAQTNERLKNKINEYENALNNMRRMQKIIVKELKEERENAMQGTKKLSKGSEAISTSAQVASYREDARNANWAFNNVKAKLKSEEASLRNKTQNYERVLSILNNKVRGAESKNMGLTKMYQQRLNLLVHGASSILSSAFSSLTRRLNGTASQKIENKKWMKETLGRKNDSPGLSHSQKVLKLTDALNANAMALFSERKDKIDNERIQSKIIAGIRRGHANEIYSIKLQREKDMGYLKTEFKKLKDHMKHADSLFRSNLDQWYKQKLVLFSRKKENIPSNSKPLH